MKPLDDDTVAAVKAWGKADKKRLVGDVRAELEAKYPGWEQRYSDWLNKGVDYLQNMDKGPVEVFKDQPIIGAGDEEAIAAWVSNWNAVNAWLQTEPSLAALKLAALYEAENKGRVEILDRILTRIFKLERREALNRLTALRR